jgi:hypothetical protein
MEDNNQDVEICTEKREERSGSNQNVKDVNNIVCLICALSKV